MIVSPRVDIWSTPASEFYGHGQILRTFLGVHDERLLICGEVQHGWSVGAATPMRPAYSERCPLFVWNSRSAEAAKAQGVDSVVVIGAPALYAQWNIAVKREPGSIIAFPQHSTPGYPFVRPRAFMDDYAAWLGKLREDNSLACSSICLYAHEYNDPGIRRACSRHGHRVVTCGYPVGSDFYLQDLFGHILTAEFVTSNAVSTPLFYAAISDKIVFVGGPVPLRAAQTVPGEQVYLEATDHEWAGQHFPEFMGELESNPAPDVGRRELGADCLQTSAQLWKMLNLVYLPDKERNTPCVYP